MDAVRICADQSPVKDVLPILLLDRATGTNIIFATKSYLPFGAEYDAKREITPETLLRDGVTVIQPRVLKNVEEQIQRTRQKAEVFTPSWVCAMMNDFLDEEWFGRKNVFGALSGRTWTPEEGPIKMPERKRWQRYVDSRRLEITCGEAPYLASRYDMETGEIIPIKDRIGILDRKLRIVNENTETEEEWLKWALRALQSVYGYEYQGDNLLIARINLLLSYGEYMEERWNRAPTAREWKEAARVISWNLWQMDGLKGTVPMGALYEDYQWITFSDTFGFSDQDDAEKERPYVSCRVYDWRGLNKSIAFDAFQEGENKTMKFDYIIGNPPYQEEVEDSENKTFMPPIYNQFMDASYVIANRVELIHPARFLFNAGQTPKEWNKKILNDPHFKILHFEADASKVFPNTYINGGIAVSYHSVDENFGRIGIFTPFEELNSILHKTHISDTQENLGSIIFNQNRFNLEALYSEYPELKSMVGSDGRDKRFRNNTFDKIPLFTLARTETDDIRVLGVEKSKRVWRYIPKRFVEPTHENLEKWKVLISSADGAAGTLGSPIPARILGEPVVTKPCEAYTQTFIGVGAVDTEDEAIAIRKYLRTRLCRTLAGVLKNTQHITPDTFSYVPLQNFSCTSDIDWSQPISDIDRQLYAKYGLSNNEITFIETYVKEME